MTVRTDLDSAWAWWNQSTLLIKWRRANPGEWAKLDEYRNGGSRPVLLTPVGKALVAETDAWLASAPVVPPSGWVVEPPRQPYTTITNAPMSALNATEIKQFADVKIDGTGDTAALFQGNAHGSSLRRCEIRRAAIGNAVTYGKHAVYGKARNLTLEDIDAECSSFCRSGFSLRFDGAVLRRFKISGAPHAITYFETSGVAGTVLVEQGTGTFTNPDTAVWMDAETDYQSVVRQSFVFRDVHFTGPASAKFLRVAANRMQGSVRVEGCTINGRPVTATDVVGVPNLAVS